MPAPLATADDFRARCHPHLQSCLDISCVGVPKKEEIIGAFEDATRLIATAINRPSLLHVVIGSSPFTIPTQNGDWSFAMKEGCLGMHLAGGVVLIDVARLEAVRSRGSYTVVFLEEFVHALMHIRDETLVAKVVSHLYPEVSELEGVYQWKKKI